MNCQECNDYIDAYIDNELDVAATILVKQHLRDCSKCQELLQGRKAVRALLNNPQVSFEVPDSLLGKIQSVLPIAKSNVKQRSASRFVIPFPWFSVPLALAATIAVMFGLVFLNQEGNFDRSRGNALAQEVISSHVRSLLATHLLDVQSTDQHTVKPWFDGKLKFAPPVRDFAEHGFRLTGGRLDYFDGREVAALVYQRKLHVINLFVWPSGSGRNTGTESFSKDGYNVSHWDRNGFAFWAVSDVNADDLKTFADLEMQQP
jgi:anti-sigma factor RsiW